MGDNVTSADLATLGEMCDTFDQSCTTLEEMALGIDSFRTAVVNGSADYGVSSNSMVTLAGTATNMRYNDAWSRTVLNAVSENHSGGGVATASASQIDSLIDGTPLSDPPPPAIEQPQGMVGIPPTSGYVDDPVNAATGNFVHGDRDLKLPGFASVIDVVRLYNSTNSAQRGVFGLGWSSMLDMRLEATGTEVTVRLSDGAVLSFAPDNSGGWTGDLRRRLHLEQDGDNWRLQHEDAKTFWLFNTEGTMIGGGQGAAEFTMTSTPKAITAIEQCSGRFVTYTLNSDGLVECAETSDGRKATYQYVDGQCVRADCPTGSIRYEVDDGYISAVIDADGVLLCRNTYDIYGRVTSQVSTHERLTHYEYLSGGSTRITDDNDGPANLMTHDKRGNLTAMFAGDGKAQRMTYDAAGHLVKSVSRSGLVTQFVYDEERDLLLRRVDPDGLSESWEYDEQARLQTQTTRAGTTQHYFYEGDSEAAARVVGPTGAEVTANHNELGLPILITDADGLTTGFEWDTDGQMVTAINGLGHRTTFDYNDAGELVAVVDPMGRAASFEVDEAGRVTCTNSIDGKSETFTYTAAGRRLSSVVDGLTMWNAEFGADGELSTFSDAAGNTASFKFDQLGMLRSVTGADGSQIRRSYNTLGQLTSIVDPAGNTAEWTYDGEGRVESATDVHRQTTSRTTNEMGQTLTSVSANGAETSYTYHPNGELASTTDAEGNTTSFDVDPLGQVTTVTLPDGGQLGYEYSAASRLVARVSAAGRRFEYSYDEAGFLASVTKPGGQQVNFDRRPDGQIASFANNDDEPVTFAFNDAGQVVGWSSPTLGSSGEFEIDGLSATSAAPGSDPTKAEYDPRGPLASCIDAAGVATQFSYDNRGRFVGSSTQHPISDNAADIPTTEPITTSVSYDPSGAVAAVTNSLGQQTTFTNTPAGRVSTIHVGGSGRSFTYDAAGRVSNVVNLNSDPLVSFSYDQLGRLTSASNAAGDTIEFDRSTTGLVETVTDKAGSTSYGYDADGLMLTRTAADGSAMTYSRDANGTIIGIKHSTLGSEIELPDLNPTSPQTIQRDDGGRLISDVQGRFFSYDRAGRLAETQLPNGESHRFTFNDWGLIATETTGAGRRLYNYNSAGQLVRLVEPNKNSIDFAYDESGRRISQVSSDGSSTTYEWDELDQLIRIIRTADDGVTTRQISYSGLRRVDQVDDISIGWDDAVTSKPLQIGDRHFIRLRGQVMDCANRAAGWVAGVGDDPYGVDIDVIGDTGSGVGLGYRNELTIDGLTFIGDRVFDPVTRSFLSTDPLPAVPGRPAFISAYVYAWNDPINFVDPTGRRPISIEEHEAILAKQEGGRLGNAWTAMKEDPWGTAAMVGVVAVGTALVVTGVGAPIGAGILIGAAAATGVGLATDNFNPRTVAISGAFGAIPGSQGITVGRAVAVGVAGGVTEDIASQVIVDGVRDPRDLNPYSIAIAGGTGGVISGGGTAIARNVPANWLPNRAAAQADVPTPQDPSIEAWRAVSRAEADDIAENGFRARPDGRSMEDKWFSESESSARQMQELLGEDTVVRAQVPTDVYESSYRVPNIDNSGPGFVVAESDLQRLRSLGEVE